MFFDRITENSKRIKANKSTFLILILSGALLLGCKRKRETQTPPLELPVAEATTSDIPIWMDFVGQTYGKSDITIQARVSGFLRGIYFREGTFVHKGDLLYVIEPAPYAAQTAQRQASVSQAEAELTNARQNYERVKPLATINAASKSDLDAAVSRLSAAQAALKAAQAALKYTEIEQSYTQVLSPVNGIIGQTKARTGDYVGPGSQYAVLNTVSQVDTIRVVFFIPEDTYFDLIRRGRADFSEIMLTISDNIAYPHRGHFDFIGRAVEQGTGSLNAQVSFPNPDTLLRPGQFARIRTVVDTLRSALLIPQQAVMRTQGISSVYALDSAGRAKQRIVSLGNTYNNMWVVNSGLDSGARVVTSGFHKVREGAVVEPMTVADSLQK